jgi:hypothetical protein
MACLKEFEYDFDDDFDDDQIGIQLQVDTLVDEMLANHEIGGTMIEQSFVDYCQALIDGEVIETDGSEFFQLIEHAVSSPRFEDRHLPINQIIQSAMGWQALKIVTSLG